ncbi:MAG: hypothetical protein ACTSVI_14055 [Promethearchaeota archaeon]
MISIREILEEKPVSIPEVKEILDKLSEEMELEKQSQEELGEYIEADDEKYYFLKSTHNYVSLFSKMEPQVAKKVIDHLVEDDGIPLLTAIQIVNINPDTPEELAIFFEKGYKRLTKEECEKLLYKIREYKEL